MGKDSMKLQDMVIEIAFDSKNYKRHPAKCVYYCIRDTSGKIHDRNDFQHATREQLLTAHVSLQAVNKLLEEQLTVQETGEFLTSVREEIEVLTMPGQQNRPWWSFVDLKKRFWKKEQG